MGHQVSLEKEVKKSVERMHNFKFRQISDFVWEIPATEKNGMNVPARIYSSKKLFPGLDSGVFDQITNVACMPGILKNAIALPDSHWGYGSPVGAVAAFDLDNGVISPGIVGFDINCLAGNTKILLKYGCYKEIKNLEKTFSDEQITFMDLASNEKKYTNAIMFLEKKPDCRVLRIITECGEEITLTEDHPLYNGQEMVKAGAFKVGENVVIHPFEGVEYENTPDDIIVDENDVTALVGKREKILKKLKKNELLPLRMNSKKLPVLSKLLGFLTGDGWIGKYHDKKRNKDRWQMRVIGSLEDLDEIKKDINSLGYNIGFTKTKYYESEIEEIGGKKRKIKGISSQLHINSQSLAILMKLLGMADGNKSRVPVSVPRWIKKSPLWIKRLYLAGLFGAELTIPYQRKGEKFRFTEPSFSQNKIKSLEKENEKFLLEIVELLSEFGVKINKIYKQKGVINSRGEETGKMAFRISSNTNNLIKLLGKIGYEYCEKRKQKSMLALAYLKKKERTIEKAREFLRQTQDLIIKGNSPSEIFLIAENRGLSKVMVKGQIYQKSTGNRITRNFPTFKEFSENHRIEKSEFVRDKIEEIEEIQYKDCVYDITMNDKDHNFIANCIISKNCGMRLITTNLTIKDVKPKIKEVVNELFQNIPVGVGKKGFVKLNVGKFVEVMETGVKWGVENGYGWKEDLERIEEHGCIKGADQSKVSEKAIQRGISQLGTLGSGNHYLEVQVAHASEIYDAEIAAAFGIHSPEQIVIMIHTGSRGFGHQVATDYLNTFEPAMRKYGITVKDRQLACAPFASQEGRNYYAAMACAANNAFVNRQVITHQIRECFKNVFHKTPEEMEMQITYDVAHNIAKVEEHSVNGKKKRVLVHRKGATRSFGPGHEELLRAYRKFGQPVIVGGSMETGSFLLVGTETAMRETFGSTLHGSGRTMSRTKAKKMVRGEQLQKEMEKRGIYVKAASYSGLAEEAGIAYKNISDVVEAVHNAGISKKVAGLKPLGNIKG